MLQISESICMETPSTQENVLDSGNECSNHVSSLVERTATVSVIENGGDNFVMPSVSVSSCVIVASENSKHKLNKNETMEGIQEGTHSPQSTCQELLSPEINNTGKSNLKTTNSALQQSGLIEDAIRPNEIGEDNNDLYVNVEPVYVFDKVNSCLVSRAWKDFCKKGKNSFLKGCKWAPDGSCILTNSYDKKLQIFNIPEQLFTLKTWQVNQLDSLNDLKKAVQIKEGGRVYDYCWYPLMSSWDPPSCCFVSCASEDPVHLWDAFDGKLRATYQSRNYADEVISPFCVNFNPDGEKLFCGFKNRVDIFNVVYPGMKPTSFNIKALSSQSGMVSTIAVNPALPDLIAVGTFQKSVGLYSVDDNCGICILNGHSGGLTHMMFSPDGSRLYTGSRMDSEIVCWDLRNPGKVLFSLLRNVATNQRIYFDITPDGKTLVSGNTDGLVSVWNLESDKLTRGDIEPVEADIVFQAHKDCSNGISINGHYPILATSSGQRHFPDIVVDDQNSSGVIFDCDSVVNKRENCIKLWWLGPVN